MTEICCLVTELKGGEGLKKIMKNSSQVIELFCILIVGLNSWMYLYVKTHQLLYFDYLQLLVCDLKKLKKLQLIFVEMFIFLKYSMSFSLRGMYLLILFSSILVMLWPYFATVKSGQKECAPHISINCKNHYLIILPLLPYLP